MGMTSFFEKKYRGKRLSGGFTLVELMVSLTVFSIVMTISVGTLLVLIDMNAKAQALYSATTNLSFALDSMTREIRTGYRYYCDTVATDPDNTSLPDIGSVRPCTGENFISFIPEEGDGTERMGYRFNQAEGSIEQKAEGATSWVPITADEVVVSSFEVVVKNPETLIYGIGTGRLIQPSVDVAVQGYVNNGLDSKTDFNIQTHILQRRLDII